MGWVSWFLVVILAAAVGSLTVDVLGLAVLGVGVFACLLVFADDPNDDGRG